LPIVEKSPVLKASLIVFQIFANLLLILLQAERAFSFAELKVFLNQEPIEEKTFFIPDQTPEKNVETFDQAFCALFFASVNFFLNQEPTAEKTATSPLQANA